MSQAFDTLVSRNVDSGKQAYIAGGDLSYSDINTYMASEGIELGYFTRKDTIELRNKYKELKKSRFNVEQLGTFSNIVFIPIDSFRDHSPQYLHGALESRQYFLPDLPVFCHKNTKAILFYNYSNGFELDVYKKERGKWRLIGGLMRGEKD